MEDIIKIIDKKAKETDFYGIISINKNNKNIFNNAYGYRNINDEIYNNLETKFGIASGTKLFTALGIGTLIEKNHITLDTEIEDILTEPISFIDKKATIKNLLTHTSGIYDYYDEEIITDYDNYFVETPWFKLETPTDYLPLFRNKKMKFKPNERVSYSNGGYVLLGIIIEKISNKLYRDYIKDYVLKPAGMNDSGFYAFNALPKNTALGYKMYNDHYVTNIYNIPIRGGGDGGLYATNSDLIKFWKNFFSYKIISRKIFENFITPHVDIWNGVKYGLGLYITEINNKKVYFLEGSDTGVGSHSKYIPEEDLIINILSNKTDGQREIVNTFKNILEFK